MGQGHYGMGLSKLLVFQEFTRIALVRLSPPHGMITRDETSTSVNRRNTV